MLLASACSNRSIFEFNGATLVTNDYNNTWTNVDNESSLSGGVLYSKRTHFVNLPPIFFREICCRK